MRPITDSDGLRTYIPALWQARTGWLQRLIDKWQTWRHR